MFGAVDGLEALMVFLPVSPNHMPAGGFGLNQWFLPDLLPAWGNLSAIVGPEHHVLVNVKFVLDQIVVLHQSKVHHAQIGSGFTDQGFNAVRMRFLFDQFKTDVRVLRPKAVHHGGQDVRGGAAHAGDAQLAAQAFAFKVRDLFERLERVQGIACVLEDGLSERGGGRAVPSALEQFLAQCSFEFVDRV